MKLHIKKSSKTDKYDALRCVRTDGSETEMMMPRQAVLPHDLVHYVVENALGFTDGFLGRVAQGADMQFVMQQAHQIDAPLVAAQLAQAEAAVESLQAQLWSEMFDEAAFIEGLEAACAMRGKPAPDLSGIDLNKSLYEAALELSRKWQNVPFYGELLLPFPAAI